MDSIISYFLIIMLVGIIFRFTRDILRAFARYFGFYGWQKVDQAQLVKLEKYSPYFRGLSSQNKKKFLWRLNQFVASKTFVARQMPEVTEEMKIVVAAFSVQITFGLPNIYLAHFKKILIYPDDYYSTINNQHHKGEVNPRFGIIVLSWKNMVQGIAIEDDGINLGIYELAHALHLENRIANEDFDYLDRRSLKLYNQLAELEMGKIRKGSYSFFRSYAATDHYEFFAVLLENFFERPQALKDYSPQLYAVSCRLLRQDPLQLSATNDKTTKFSSTL